MVGRSQIKLIRSLHQKKHRNQHSLFIVEGIKAVKELLGSSINAFKIFCTDTGIFEGSAAEIVSTTNAELQQMSTLKNPNEVLGVFHIPKPGEIDFEDWILVLDDVRDPGNLGTIIRLCDWFGMPHLLCSPQTVDCYNPKVLQATMGSIARVNIVYKELGAFLKQQNLPTYGAFMDGVPVVSKKLPKAGILIMGNEANGISGKVEALLSKKISIPQYGTKSAESLNVATATAILLNEIRSEIRN